LNSFHIAQVNVALAKDNMESEVMQGFVSRLDEMNALADRAEGFVWRLKDDGGSATAVRAFNDPLLLVNISVWQNLEALKQYVYKSLHVELIRDRGRWFHKIPEFHQALWWIAAGHIPSVQEGKQKLEHIRKYGPSQDAFTFAKPYPTPTHGSLRSRVHSA
jgi:hypothetical protein